MAASAVTICAVILVCICAILACSLAMVVFCAVISLAAVFSSSLSDPVVVSSTPFSRFEAVKRKPLVLVPPSVETRLAKFVVAALLKVAESIDNTPVSSTVMPKLASELAAVPLL